MKSSTQFIVDITKFSAQQTVYILNTLSRLIDRKQGREEKDLYKYNKERDEPEEINNESKKKVGL